MTPVVGLGGRARASRTLYPSPIDHYTVGPELELVGGGRIWTREQGRVSIAALGSYLHRGLDRRAGAALEETGGDILSVGCGADLTVLASRSDSVVLTLTGRAPVLQVVGDPWLAENWAASAGLTVSR